MKALKTVIAVFLVALSTSTFANQEPESSKISMDHAVKTYIDAIASGKVKGFTEILDNNVKFTITRGEKIISYSRSEMLSFLKNSENITQNCITEHALVEQNALQAIIKVTMKYDTFSRVNYVTMAQTKKGWKITNVSSAFI